MVQNRPIILATKTIKVEQIFLLLRLIKIAFTFNMLLTSDLIVMRNGEFEGGHVVRLNNQVE